MEQVNVLIFSEHGIDSQRGLALGLQSFAGLVAVFSVNGMLTIGREIPLLLLRSVPMVLNAITEKL
ncbi:hypothetical protein ACQZ4Z_26400, partial [Agrobacterium vitis]